MVPCTREATLVHMIDNLGGRLGSFDRLEKELAPGRRWSGFDRAIGGGAFFAERDRRREPRADEPAREPAERADAAHAKPPETPQIAGRRQARARIRLAVGFYLSRPMAKDTEKLIRQLSLISYLMAERRPVTALEIRRDVEGYSGMNEDAFARRFYADRSELESLRIQLTVERPADGAAEQENYSLRPENFHLPAIAFTDKELAALQTALSLLDGEFAYAEPLRLALQQITWGRPSPLRAPEQRSVALGITASAGGHELSARLAKVETAIFRNKTITVRLLHDGARRGRHAPRRPLPPAVPGRPVLPARLLARAQGDPRLPPVADPRQGLLRDEGRARLPPPGRLRPARLRQPRRLAARRGARRRRDR